MSKKKRDINDVMRDAKVFVPDGMDEEGNVIGHFAIDLRKMEQNTWVGQDGREHDVTEGPCYCGAWHDKTEIHHLPVGERND